MQPGIVVPVHPIHDDIPDIGFRCQRAVAERGIPSRGFVLEQPHHRFGGRVDERIPDGADRWDQPFSGQRPGVPLRGIFTAGIRIKPISA